MKVTNKEGLRTIWKKWTKKVRLDIFALCYYDWRIHLISNPEHPNNTPPLILDRERLLLPHY